MACEDYPCCGHGPKPYGDGGGCPNSNGQFNCTQCGALLPVNHPRTLCNRCLKRGVRELLDDLDHDYSMNY